MLTILLKKDIGGISRHGLFDCFSLSFLAICETITFATQVNIKDMSAVNTLSSNELMEMENQYGAHNYHPLPVVLAKGEGVHVWAMLRHALRLRPVCPGRRTHAATGCARGGPR